MFIGEGKEGSLEGGRAEVRWIAHHDEGPLFEDGTHEGDPALHPARRQGSPRGCRAKCGVSVRCLCLVLGDSGSPSGWEWARCAAGSCTLKAPAGRDSDGELSRTAGWLGLGQRLLLQQLPPKTRGSGCWCGHWRWSLVGDKLSR